MDREGGRCSPKDLRSSQRGAGRACDWRRLGFELIFLPTRRLPAWMPLRYPDGPEPTLGNIGFPAHSIKPTHRARPWFSGTLLWLELKNVRSSKPRRGISDHIFRPTPRTIFYNHRLAVVSRPVALSQGSKCPLQQCSLVRRSQ